MVRVRRFYGLLCLSIGLFAVFWLGGCNSAPATFPADAVQPTFDQGTEPGALVTPTQLLMTPTVEKSAPQISGLAEQSISVDMIIQSPSREGDKSTDVTFTVPKSELARCQDTIRKTAEELGAASVEFDLDIVKVSIVGLGMRSHAGVAAKMFQLLAKEGINIHGITTSEIKLSCIIESKYAELAVRALHEGFELDKAQAPSVPPPKG